jgi:hypothetical protein
VAKIQINFMYNSTSFGNKNIFFGKLNLCGHNKFYKVVMMTLMYLLDLHSIDWGMNGILHIEMKYEDFKWNYK